jgi:hypothetical protein
MSRLNRLRTNWKCCSALTEACDIGDQLLAALERIANEPCDHGPGPFCPRLLARAAIAKAKGEVR